MNKQEMLKRLADAGVNKSTYAIDGEFENEVYVLREEPDGSWAVYYGERGLRTGLKIFASEKEACDYFLSLILSDPTTRR